MCASPGSCPGCQSRRCRKSTKTATFCGRFTGLPPSKESESDLLLAFVQSELHRFSRVACPPSIYLCTFVDVHTERVMPASVMCAKKDGRIFLLLMYVTPVAGIPAHRSPQPRYVAPAKLLAYGAAVLPRSSRHLGRCLGAGAPHGVLILLVFPGS